MGVARGGPARDQRVRFGEHFVALPPGRDRPAFFVTCRALRFLATPAAGCHEQNEHGENP